VGADRDLWLKKTISGGVGKKKGIRGIEEKLRKNNRGTEEEARGQGEKSLLPA